MIIISRAQEALSEVLTSGYQILPDAFELLQSLDDEYDIVHLIHVIIQTKKASEYNKFEITKQDIQNMLPQPTVKERITENEMLECELKIKSDVDVNPLESDGIGEYRSLMNSRFMKLLKIVKQRPDSSQIQKISHLVSIGKQGKIAGLLLDKRVRRTGVEIIIDDDTGSLTAYAVDEGVKRRLSELLMDQFIVAEVGVNNQGNFLVKAFHTPDIPDRVSTTSKKTAYIILTSDIHIGSKGFLEGSFLQFLKWLSGGLGELDVVNRVVCIVVGGDAIDGIGVYSEQKNDLNIYSVTSQYEVLIQYLRLIPRHIKIILMPGDHDPTRRALPQPRIPERYVGGLSTMENVVCLGNPSRFTVNGVKFLTYHGKSIEDVVTTTPGLNITRPAQAMKVLLKARHLAPLLGGKTPVAPDREDNLVIEEVPDVFHAGHLHTLDLERYRGTLILNSGSWQAQTLYQQSMGIVPTPSVVPLVNLASLEVITKSFVSATPT